MIFFSRLYHDLRQSIIIFAPEFNPLEFEGDEK